MKRICHITTVHSLFDARIFYKECQTLVKNGYNVSLIVQHEKKKIIEGIEIISLFRPQNRFCRIFCLTKKAYKLALEQKVDIYHFHDPEFLPWAVKLKKKTGAKIIYDIHENISNQILTKSWIPKTLRKTFSKAYQLIEKRSLKYIDWIILAEDSYLKIYKNYKNVIVLKNYFLISNRFSYKIKKKQDDLFQLVYVGGISKERGIFEMIEVINILKQNSIKIRLNIVGLIPERIKCKIDNLIEKYELKSYVMLYGRLSYPEAQKVIEKSILGLSILYPIPNYIESLPTKMFEYMAAGLPVIASNFPLWKEIIEKNNCGICVNPLDSKEITRAVQYLKENREEAEKMGENGRKAVLEKYNWENESKKLLNIYKLL